MSLFSGSWLESRAQIEQAAMYRVCLCHCPCIYAMWANCRIFSGSTPLRCTALSIHA